MEITMFSGCHVTNKQRELHDGFLPCNASCGYFNRNIETTLSIDQYLKTFLLYL